MDPTWSVSVTSPFGVFIPKPIIWAINILAVRLYWHDKKSTTLRILMGRLTICSVAADTASSSLTRTEARMSCLDSSCPRDLFFYLGLLYMNTDGGLDDIFSNLKQIDSSNTPRNK